MEPVGWIVVGVVAGLLARWIAPGSAPDGLIVNVLLGVAGASAGGFVVGVLGGSGVTGFDAWSVLMAAMGAVFLLSAYGIVAGRTA